MEVCRVSASINFWVGISMFKDLLKNALHSSIFTRIYFMSVVCLQFPRKKLIDLLGQVNGLTFLSPGFNIFDERFLCLGLGNDFGLQIVSLEQKSASALRLDMKEREENKKQSQMYGGTMCTVLPSRDDTP